MDVTYLTIDPDQPSEQALRLAASELSHGRVVAYPTDTLYGLAADPRNADAVDCIYRLKGRASVAPLPLIAANIDQVNACVTESSPLACRLAECFWPGPLTLIYDAGATLAPAMLAEASQITKELPDGLSLILDGGPTTGDLPSTIIDARGSAPVLIRSGIVPWERVLQSLA